MRNCDCSLLAALWKRRGILELSGVINARQSCRRVWYHQQMGKTEGCRSGHFLTSVFGILDSFRANFCQQRSGFNQSKESICQVQKRQNCSGEIRNDRSLTGERKD